MVRKLRNQPLSKRIKDIFSSHFFVPYLILFIAIITLPVIYMVLKHPLEIREHAATIASGSVVINTDETSFQDAAQQIIPPTTINIMVSVLIIIALFCFIGVFIFYRRKNQ